MNGIVSCTYNESNNYMNPIKLIFLLFQMEKYHKMLPYQYIAVALLSTAFSVKEKMDFLANDQCFYEEYRSCYIPDHCIYFDKYYDFSPIIDADYMNIKLHAYYDINSDYYMIAEPPRMVTSSHPLIKYYKQLEVTSSSVPLYNASYTYVKDLTKYKESHFDEIFDLLADLLQ